jgi:hypothetical protein
MLRGDAEGELRLGYRRPEQCGTRVQVGLHGRHVGLYLTLGLAVQDLAQFLEVQCSGLDEKISRVAATIRLS